MKTQAYLWLCLLLIFSMRQKSVKSIEFQRLNQFDPIKTIKNYCVGKYLDFCSPDHLKISLQLIHKKQETIKQMYIRKEHEEKLRTWRQEKQRRLKLKQELFRLKMTHIFRKHFLDRHF